MNNYNKIKNKSNKGFYNTRKKQQYCITPFKKYDSIEFDENAIKSYREDELCFTSFICSKDKCKQRAVELCLKNLNIKNNYNKTEFTDIIMNEKWGRIMEIAKKTNPSFKNSYSLYKCKMRSQIAIADIDIEVAILEDVKKLLDKVITIILYDDRDATDVDQDAVYENGKLKVLMIDPNHHLFISTYNSINYDKCKEYSECLSKFWN